MPKDEVRRITRCGGALRWFFIVPFRRQSYKNIAYLLLAFPLGLAYFVTYAVGFSLGIALTILLVGIVILGIVIFLALSLAGFERLLTNRLLGTEIRGQPRLPGDGTRARVRSLVVDRRTYTALVYLPVKFILGLVSFVIIFTAISTAFGMLLVPLYYDQPGLYVGVVTDRAPEIHETIYLGWNYMLVGFEAAFTFGYWEIDSLGQATVVAAGGMMLFVLTFHVCNGLAWLWGRFAVLTLDDGFDPLAAARDGITE